MQLLQLEGNLCITPITRSALQLCLLTLQCADLILENSHLLLRHPQLLLVLHHLKEITTTSVQVKIYFVQSYLQLAFTFLVPFVPEEVIISKYKVQFY